MAFTQAQQDLIGDLIRAANAGQAAAQPPVALAGRQPRSIPCSNYSATSDFEQWLATFQDNVRVAYNLPIDDGDLDARCLNWLSAKLDPEARSIYEHLPPATKADWDLLVEALRDAFGDDHDKLEFLSTMDSFRRKPGMSLKDYRNQLVRKMNRYQGALLIVPEEFQRVAVQRFRLGLQDPALSAHIMMACRGNDQTLDRAFETASAWEITMKHCLGHDPATKPQTLLGTMYGMQNTLAPMESGQGRQEMLPKVTEQLNDLTTKVKEHDLGIAELKAAHTLTNDNISGLRTDVQGAIKTMTQGFGSLNLRGGMNPRFPRPYQSMPNFAPRQQTYAPRRGFAPRSQPQIMQRPQGPVTPGITGGPGFIDNTTSIPCPNPRPLAPMELKTPEQSDQVPHFPNPYIAEDGAFDMGQGWTDYGLGWTPSEHNSAVAEGYEAYPTGSYSYGSQNF
jgi:hypothetical protein